jgi:hypothetical protein
MTSNRHRSRAQHLGEERPYHCGVAPHCDQDVDDLAVLIDGMAGLGVA